MTGWGIATVVFGLILIVGPIITFGVYLKEAKAIIKEYHQA